MIAVVALTAHADNGPRIAWWPMPSKLLAGRAGLLLLAAPLGSTYAHHAARRRRDRPAVLDEPLWLGAFVGALLVFGALALKLRGRGGATVR